MLFLHPTPAHAAWTIDDIVVESGSAFTTSTSGGGIASSGYTINNPGDTIDAVVQGASSVTYAGAVIAQGASATADAYVSRSYVSNDPTDSTLSVTVTGAVSGSSGGSGSVPSPGMGGGGGSAQSTVYDTSGTIMAQGSGASYGPTAGYRYATLTPNASYTLGNYRAYSFGTTNSQIWTATLGTNANGNFYANATVAFTH